MSTEMTAYASFKDYSIRYDMNSHEFNIWYRPQGLVLDTARITMIRKDDTQWTLADYGQFSFSYAKTDESTTLTLHYAQGPAAQPELVFHFVAGDRGVKCTFLCRGDLDIHIKGLARWGADMARGTFAMNLNRQAPDMRCAHGPAASVVDNALFDRNTDSALELICGYTTRFDYDWDQGAYRFTMNTGGNDYIRSFELRAHERVYREKFNIPYTPVNPDTTFARPPAGWMTWYAVQFDASEETVLENARWQSEHLKDYGADALWVDWEWYHSDMSGVGKPDTDTFRPDPRRYPNGLKYVADEIKKLGLTPALWIGAMNDPTENEFIKAHPETVLVQKPSWCGQYFMDLTHPLYLNEFLPRAFQQILDWGYEALKWDCMPIQIQYCDQYHDRFYDPDVSTDQAMANAVAAARRVVGKDFYMLYCSGLCDRGMNIAAQGFDATRIGGDIFKWEEFISQCVAKVMRHYALHNVALLNDPDNVVLRPEFNSYDQALSRLSFVALLGLPITLGDNLPELPDDRVELLRRGLPPIDCHPMDVRHTVHDLTIVKLNLAVNKPYGQWNVVDVLNLLEKDVEVDVDLLEDLHLSPGEGPYHIYDFWNDEYLGLATQRFRIPLRACASKVFSVHKLLERPQVISTSRHIAQGVYDLTDVRWDEASLTLSGVSMAVAAEDYTLLLHIPQGYEPLAQPGLSRREDGLWALTARPEQTGELPWSVPCKLL